MRSLVEELFNKYSPVDCEVVVNAFNTRLMELGIEGVEVISCDFDEEGNIFVIFQDTDGDEMEVIFTIDPDEGVIAINNDDEDSEFITIADLDTLLPSIHDTVFGQYVNLTDLSWLNASGLFAILSGGDIDFDSDDSVLDPYTKNSDPYGYIKNNNIEEGRKIAVIRGGKKVKLAIVRKKRKKVLTGKQKSAIRSAARKRKVQASKTNRKRAKSLRIRKRMKIKTPKLSRFQKIAGGANRKR